MKHFLSFDIEDWFDVPFVKPFLVESRFEKLPSVVESGTRSILVLLGQNQVKATFFVVGQIAERFPDLVREIVDQGHEVGTHGYLHVTPDQMSKVEFEEDLVKSLDAIEKATGHRPKGYRAPLGSLAPNTLWVLDLLKKQGLMYDSSIYPAHPLVYGGIRGFAQEVHQILPDFWEVPLSTAPILGLPCPISGGFYLRFLPFLFFKRALRRRTEDQLPAVLYYHSWEFSTDYPRPIPWGAKRFIQYYRLDSVRPKLEDLIRSFSFGPICDAIPQSLSSQEKF